MDDIRTGLSSKVHRCSRVALVVGPLVAVALAVACSSSDDAAAPAATADAATTETSTPHDTGVAKDSSSFDSATTCFPDKTPPAKSAHACAVGEVSAVYGGCFEGGDCVLTRDDHPKCSDCLFSKQSDSTWGPWVEMFAGGVQGNITGCIELEGDADCAAKSAKVEACMHNACCNSAKPSEYNTCAKSVQLSECNELNSARLTCATALPNGSKCLALAHDTAKDLLMYFGELFCGPAADAGSDAAVDAPVSDAAGDASADASSD